MKRLKRYLLAVTLCLPILLMGCRGGGQQQATAGGRGTITIDFDQPNGMSGQGNQGMGGPVDNFGSQDPYGPGQDPTGQWIEEDGQYDPSTGPENGNPPAPGNGQDMGPRTDLDPPRGPITKTAELKELKDKYGIELGGNYSDKEIQNTLVSAQQYLPDETKNVKINFFIGKKPAEVGVQGQALIPETEEEIKEGTIIELFSDIMHVNFHELTHHITLHPSNKRAKQVADETFAKVPGYPNNTPKEYIPSDYAMSNKDEYTAEMFPFLREKEKGIDGGEPPLPAFNPPEDFRKVARKLFVTP